MPSRLRARIGISDSDVPAPSPPISTSRSNRCSGAVTPLSVRTKQARCVISGLPIQLNLSGSKLAFGLFMKAKFGMLRLTEPSTVPSCAALL